MRQQHMDLGRFYRIGLVIYTILSHTNGSRYDEDYSKGEILLYEYHRSRNELKWIWSVKPFCRILCPHQMGIGMYGARVLPTEILLPAAGCAKMEMEVYHCFCASRRPTEGRVSVKDKAYVNGPDGQIYEVFKIYRGYGHFEECEDFQTWSIIERINPSINATNTFLQFPKLWGVSQIFHFANARRIPARQWHKDHISDPVIESNEDSDENHEISPEDAYLNALEVLLQQYFNNIGDDSDDDDSDGLDSPDILNDTDDEGNDGEGDNNIPGETIRQALDFLNGYVDEGNTDNRETISDNSVSDDDEEEGDGLVHLLH